MVTGISREAHIPHYMNHSSQIVKRYVASLEHPRHFSEGLWQRLTALTRLCEEEVGDSTGVTSLSTLQKYSHGNSGHCPACAMFGICAGLLPAYMTAYCTRAVTQVLKEQGNAFPERLWDSLSALKDDCDRLAAAKL